ncbi:N-acyl-L-homoserine lactone synthetase [Hoeflea phototrophica DFL-43]|uniref:Acyl-homoserine-lactone synthase n=1 Tax=Hoeflea phototrophica (strain DSM 17068 / NCIMB 14078 / DFL-43) TaxID=411684 RepID=A9D311_HOEPD|nr:acyl-homoserine-lactone synthase [Hoeflea phototrophica]EDQ34314.1 N-acyl-L-homoserine lactone synthetase [Hoeflea phototrophica DFL-43]
MFLTIQAHQYDTHRPLLDDMYRLRKKVFVDEAKWTIPHQNGREIDRYDTLGPAYLVWCNSERTRLYGSLRLLPTTGPTLLYDTFRATFPGDACLAAPGIWEGTRLCIDKAKLGEDHPDIQPVRAFGLMLLALGECALAHGIHTMVTNYEPHVSRVYTRTGLSVDEIGRADGYGRFPVCCGVFEVSENVITAMRHKLNVGLPLYRHAHLPSIIRNAAAPRNSGTRKVAAHA